MLTFFPLLFLAMLFRRTRNHLTRISKIKELFQSLEEVNETRRRAKSKRKMTLPWWFRMVLYLISFSLILVCIGLTIIKGIEFGDEQVRNWLISFLISVLIGVFIIQPLHVS